ncbi:Phox homologous domain [Phytophthora cactorum]|nr:Phox homologous domain [Phytophthora cactorum]
MATGMKPIPEFPPKSTNYQLLHLQIIIDDHEETSTSVPPAPVEEEAEEEEQEAAAPAEEEPIEQPPVAAEVPATVDEPVAVDEPSRLKPVTVEAPVVPKQKSLKNRLSRRRRTPGRARGGGCELQVEKSVASDVEKSAVTSVNAPVWTFVADKVSFTIGVAFFNIAGSNTEGDEVHLTKRYSEFKVLHTEIAKLMTREELPECPPRRSCRSIQGVDRPGRGACVGGHPRAEAPVPESIKTTEPEPAVEAPPASADEFPPAPASVPDEEARRRQCLKSLLQLMRPQDRGGPKTEEKVSEVEPEATPVEAEPEAPKSEPVVEEEAPKSEPAVETPVEKAPVEEEETPVEAPKSEVVAPISEVKPATEGTLTFKAEEVTFNDKGVAFYNFDGSDASNPANDVHVSKRYSEFKALHAQLTQQLGDNQDEKTQTCQRCPRPRSYKAARTRRCWRDRKVQFTALLNAIAAHPVASQSDVFQAFLA